VVLGLLALLPRGLQRRRSRQDAQERVAS